MAGPGKEDLKLVIRIRLGDIVRDIQSGLGDVPIMEKYGIRPADYIDILQRLKGVRAVDERYLEGRIGHGEEAADADRESRRLPRCYLVAEVRVVDLLDRNVRGEVLDLTEQGCKVRGIECQVGEKRRFRVEAEGYPGDALDCSFAALCRWGKWEQDEGSYVAGFEITDLSAKDRKNLQGVIRLLTIADT